MKIFVYGTLKRGFHNHKCLGDSKFLTGAVLMDFEVYDLPYGFPGIKPKNGRGVFGEIYEVSEEQLPRVDMLEGYREDSPQTSMYLRIKAVALTDDDTLEEVYTYMWNGRLPVGSELIKNGEWR